MQSLTLEASHSKKIIPSIESIEDGGKITVREGKKTEI
jgi:hypothetical protein